MAGFEGLVKGAKIVGTLLLAFIGIFSLAMIGGIVVGVIANTVTDGTIDVSSAMNTALVGYETSYISTVTSVLSPLTIIAALVIVVVLIAIFFVKGGFANLRPEKGGIQ